MAPKLRDVNDELIDRLTRLVRALETREFGQTDINIQKTQAVTVDEPDTANTPTYFSTGTQRLAVTNTAAFTRLDFGFIAKTVNIRTTDDIVVAFSNPDVNQGRRIKVRQNTDTKESPFTIGGHHGIDSAFLWVSKASTATTDPGIEVIAYR